MWIKRLEIKNFQKHSNFTIDFINGVNMLWGETDVGKSCIIRAIKWCLFNEPKSDSIRKIDTDVTSVKVFFDSGVAVERIKSDKENAYVLMTPSGETKRFDSIGKSIPIEVSDSIGIYPMIVDKDNIHLNISPQFEAPFMFSESSSFRLKVFNKLTGNDLLDSVAQSFNKDILQIGRESKMIENSLSENMQKKKDLTIEFDSLKSSENMLSVVLARVKKSIENFYILRKLRDEIRLLKSTQFDLINSIEKIKYPENVDNLLERVVSYNNIVNIQLSYLENIRSRTEVSTALLSINIPDGVDDLFKRIINFDELLSIKGRLLQLKDSVNDCDVEISKIALPDIEVCKRMGNRVDFFYQVLAISEEISTLRIKFSQSQKSCEDADVVYESEKFRYFEALKLFKKCPICSSDINDDSLKNIEV